VIIKPDRTLSLLLLLLAASGCAALIYEIVWLQLLQLVIGSSAESLGLLLAGYIHGGDFIANYLEETRKMGFVSV
jgi:hypothetical protein